VPDQDLEGFSEQGTDLVAMVVTMMREGEDEDDYTYYVEFCDTYPEFIRNGSDADSEGGSGGGSEGGSVGDPEDGSGDAEGEPPGSGGEYDEERGLAADMVG